MHLCIDEDELRKALKDIEKAKENGFNHCLSVFRLKSAGRTISDNQLEYSDMVERAHPTDGNYDWGRFQGVTKKNKFVDGKLVPID